MLWGYWGGGGGGGFSNRMNFFLEHFPCMIFFGLTPKYFLGFFGVFFFFYIFRLNFPSSIYFFVPRPPSPL